MSIEIPGYKILRTLGKGGMATVYLAVQESFEREVAIKVMASSLSEDATFQERFLREAKTIARISHPHIVAVYDVGCANSHYYFAMEYHPGGDLKARGKSGLSVKESLRITREVARALEYAHQHGYVHRDIKPDNILFRKDGSAVLTDFGIAKATEGDSNLTQMGTVAGTPKYMSPEQARGLALDGDSDFYSLGVVLYEMLTGELPFKADDPIALGIMHLNDPVPRMPGTMAHFQPLIDSLMAKLPAQRPQSGEQLIAMIDELEASYDPHAGMDAAGGNEATVFRSALPGNGKGADKRGAGKKARAGVQPLAAKSAPSKKGTVLIPLLLVTVLAAAGGGWYLINAPQEAPAPVPAPVPQPVPVVAEPVVPEPVVNPVATLLAEADAAFRADRLMPPAADNAYAKYQGVLALDSANVDARSGLQAISNRLVAFAREAAGNSDLVAARDYLAQASQAMPDNPAIAELQSKWRAQLAQKRPAVRAAIRESLREELSAPQPVAAAPVAEPQQQVVIAAPAAPRADLSEILKRGRIQGLLRGAELARQDNKLDTAIDKYKQVLALDPGNNDAREGLKRVQTGN